MSNASKDHPRLAKPAGQVQIEPLLCKSCGLCAEYCPQKLVKAATDVPAEQRTGPVMNAAGHVVYAVFDPEGKCNGCGICAAMCPEGAIVVYRRKKPASKPVAGVSKAQAGKSGEEDADV